MRLLSRVPTLYRESESGSGLQSIMAEVEKVYVSYDQIHTLCQVTGDRILKEFRPDLIIAIGGGGFIPARILRTFLKVHGQKNIPIQAIGLVLYEDLGTGVEEQIGTEVQRIQWLDFSTLGGASLVGKRILIVDEVDDTRTTYGLSSVSSAC